MSNKRKETKEIIEILRSIIYTLIAILIFISMTIALINTGSVDSGMPPISPMTEILLWISILFSLIGMFILTSSIVLFLKYRKLKKKYEENVKNIIS